MMMIVEGAIRELSADRHCDFADLIAVTPLVVPFCWYTFASGYQHVR